MDNEARIKANKAKFQMVLKPLQPKIQKLIQEVHAGVGLAGIIGFIYFQDPVGIVQFGNIGNQGETLTHLLVLLSTLVHEMKTNPTGRYRNVPFTELGIATGKTGENPEDLADELTKMILVSGLDTSRADALLELAQRYWLARRPPNAPSETK